MDVQSMGMSPYLPEGLPTPTPASDGLDRPFWDGLRRHTLCLQACRSCHKFQMEPEWTCRHCGSFDLEWAEVEASGQVLSWVRVWHPVHPSLESACPYLVVVVELPRLAVRLTGNLVGDPLQEVRIGERVIGVFEDHGDQYTLLQWAKAEPEHSAVQRLAALGRPSDRGQATSDTRSRGLKRHVRG